MSSAYQADSVREQVVVAIHDTIREVTTITVRENERGDTLRVVQVTDRTRSSKRDQTRLVVERLEMRADTVEKAFQELQTQEPQAIRGVGERKSSRFVDGLKWVFWILVAVLLLIGVIRFRGKA